MSAGWAKAAEACAIGQGADPAVPTRNHGDAQRVGTADPGRCLTRTSAPPLPTLRDRRSMDG